MYKIAIMKACSKLYTDFSEDSSVGNRLSAGRGKETEVMEKKPGKILFLSPPISFFQLNLVVSRASRGALRITVRDIPGIHFLRASKKLVPKI